MNFNLRRIPVTDLVKFPIQIIFRVASPVGIFLIVVTTCFLRLKFFRETQFLTFFSSSLSSCDKIERVKNSCCKKWMWISWIFCFFWFFSKIIVSENSNCNVLSNLIQLFFRYSVQLTESCYSPDEYKGNCIELAKCDSLMKLRRKENPTHPDRLYLSLSFCGYLNGAPKVCCTESSLPEKLAQTDDGDDGLLSQIREQLNQAAAAQETK